LLASLFMISACARTTALAGRSWSGLRSRGLSRNGARNEPPPGSGRNGEVDLKDGKRSNETNASTSRLGSTARVRDVIEGDNVMITLDLSNLIGCFYG
jgi:hypothetical protein